jgi:hypothetical protein
VEPVTILFGAACAITFALATLSRDAVARHLACLLGAIWALATVAWMANALALLPMLDLWLGIAALQIWWSTPAHWLALVVHAVAIRLLLHVLDALTGHLFLIAYLHALNATFVWMLVVVAYGGGHVRDILLRGVRCICCALSPASTRGLTGGR